MCLNYIFDINDALKYSRLSVSRSRRDPLKHFELSVLRHIRFAELRKIPIEQATFSNEHNLTPSVKNILWKYCRKGEKLLPRSNFSSVLKYFITQILDFCVKTRARFSFRDKRLFEIIDFEIKRVDCISI